MFEKIKHILSLIFGRNTLDYICGTEALPLPFSQEEESDKISLLESGDERAKAELVEHNLRLVVYIAKKFEGSGVDGDDLVSVGTIGLIKAINSFKSEKNIKLAAQYRLGGQRTAFIGRYGHGRGLRVFGHRGRSRAGAFAGFAVQAFRARTAHYAYAFRA